MNYQLQTRTVPISMVRRIASIIFGLALLTLFVFLIVKVFGLILSLEKEIAAAILAGMLTVFASVISFLVSKHIERNREIEREIREKKIPIYERIIELFFRSMFCPDPLKQEKSEVEIASELRDFSLRAMIWGSDDVYVKWTDLMSALKTTKPVSDSQEDMVLQKMIPLGNFLLSIRNDIDHKNKNISNVDIWRPFINDIDPILAGMKKKK